MERSKRVEKEIFAKLCGFKYLDYLLNDRSVEIARALVKGSPIDIMYALEIAHQNGALEAIEELAGRGRQIQMEWLKHRQSALRIINEDKE
jgi:hypothetical protein